jgi:hyperosmotically inducible protein
MKRFEMYCFVLSLAAAWAIPATAQQNNAADRIKGNTAATPDRITREVRHELVMLPYYGVFDDLTYRVDGSSVTLMGSVTNPTLKSDAGNVVKKIEGVEKVDNQIEVLPLSSMDDQIRRAEFRTINGQPGLDRYGLQAIPPIHIIVKNGSVTLVGVVASEADKNLAGLRAKTVTGTFAVVNNLRVESR